MLETGSFRAIIVLNTRKWLQSSFPPEKYQTFLQQLPEKDRKIWENDALKPNTMLPAQLYRNLYEVGGKVYSPNPDDFFRDGSAHTAEEDIKNQMQSLGAVGLPSFLGRQMVLVWRHYFNIGSLSVMEYSKNSIDFSLEYAKDYGKGSCLGTEGWGRKGLEVAGAKNIHVHQSECVFRGDYRCAIHFKWELEANKKE